MPLKTYSKQKKKKNQNVFDKSIFLEVNNVIIIVLASWLIIVFLKSTITGHNASRMHRNQLFRDVRNMKCSYKNYFFFNFLFFLNYFFNNIRIGSDASLTYYNIIRPAVLVFPYYVINTFRFWAWRETYWFYHNFLSVKGEVIYWDFSTVEENYSCVIIYWHIFAIEKRF